MISIAWGETPEKNVAILRDKGYKLSFFYDEVSYEAHRRAFTVAKMMRMDLLQDMHESLVKAQQSGAGFKEWKKSIIPTLQAKGWWGERDIVNPETGEVKTINIGSRRLRTIFDTNMRMSREIAKCREQMLLPASTYWRYVSKLLPTTREAHRARHGVILPRDHPWWKTNRPLNGYGCKCSVTAHSKAQIKKRGWKISKEAPEDIFDKGWDHSPCEEQKNLTNVWDQKALEAPDWIKQRASNDIDAFNHIDAAFSDAPIEARGYVIANLHKMTFRVDNTVRNSHYRTSTREMVLRTDSNMESLIHTIRHETGHFVDDINGWISTDNRFATPLLQDIPYLKRNKNNIEIALRKRENVMLDDLFYLASGGTIGFETRENLVETLKDKGLAKESFADIWALYTSDEKSYTVVKQYFPKTVTAFEKLLLEIFGGGE